MLTLIKRRWLLSIGIRFIKKIDPDFKPYLFYAGTLEEEVYLPRHRFVKARGHPPQTLQKYRIAFATSHKAPEQIHKLLF